MRKFRHKQISLTSLIYYLDICDGVLSFLSASYANEIFRFLTVFNEVSWVDFLC